MLMCDAFPLDNLGMRPPNHAQRRHLVLTMPLAMLPPGASIREEQAVSSQRCTLHHSHAEEDQQEPLPKAAAGLNV